MTRTAYVKTEQSDPAKAGARATGVDRAKADPVAAGPGPSALLMIQRTAGNRALLSLMPRPPEGPVVRRVPRDPAALHQQQRLALNGPGDVPVPGLPPIVLEIDPVADANSPQDHVTPAQFVQVEEAWKKLVGPTGLGLGNAGSGLLIKDASVAEGSHIAAGQAGTASAQALQLLQRFAKEIPRSRAMRATIIELVDDPDPAHAVNLFMGRGSAGFYDSYANMTFDIEHEGYLPEDPHTLDGEKVGVTKGELLMHVLEERLYMVRQGLTYEEAHARCLAKDSRQNQYRLDRGETGFSTEFDCAAYNGTSAAPNADTALKTFIARDSKARAMYVEAIDTKNRKAADESQTSTSSYRQHGESVEQALAKRLVTATDICRGLLIVDVAEKNAAPSTMRTRRVFVDNKDVAFGTCLSTIEALADERLALNTPQREQALATATSLGKAQMQTDWASWFDAEVAGFKSRQSANKGKARIGSQPAVVGQIDVQHAAATGHLAQAPTDEGSRFLQTQRQARDTLVPTGLNDAPNFGESSARVGNLTGEKNYQSETNCAAVTVAAVNASTSSQVLDRYRELVGARVAQSPLADPGTRNRMRHFQDQDVWWEEVNDPTRQRRTAEASDNPGAATAALDAATGRTADSVGDAQWYGIHEVLVDLAARRNAVANGTLKWSVERFREPELNPAKTPTVAAAPDEALAKMSSYPNGTQFVVWLHGRPPYPSGHYVYGEQYMGAVVVEDYQPNVSGVSASQRSKFVQHAILNGLPHYKKYDYRSDIWDGVAFWAIVPHGGAGAAADAAAAQARSDTDVVDQKRAVALLRNPPPPQQAAPQAPQPSAAPQPAAPQPAAPQPAAPQPAAQQPAVRPALPWATPDPIGLAIRELSKRGWKGGSA